MKEITIGKKVIFKNIAAGDFVKLGAVFLMSRVSAAELFPFGLAFWAATMTDKMRLIGLLTMILGVLSSGGEVLKYLLAAGLWLLYTYFRKNKTMDVLFVGMSVVVSGAISVLFNGISGLYTAICVVEGIIAALTYVISAKTINFCKSYKGMEKAEQEDFVSAILLCCIVLIGFSGIYISKYIELSVFLGIYLILFISRCSTLPVAGSIGLVLGFICSINHSPAISVMGTCGVAALTANVLKDFGKGGIAIGFVIGILICTGYAGEWQNPPVGAAETGIAILIFVLTPNYLFSKAEAVMLKAFRGTGVNKEIRLKGYLTKELKQIANVFTELAEGFLAFSEKGDNLQAGDMFDRVAERVCADCPDWSKCWVENFNEMYRHMYEILKVIETKGYCDINNMPIVFKDKCINNETFIMEFNHMYEIYKQTALWHGEANSGQDMVARQYHEISNLIRGISDELESGFSFMEEAEIKLDAALEKAGFFTKEISVIENSSHEPEVYISAEECVENEVLERVVSETIGMPMHMEFDGVAMKFVVHNKYCAEYAVCQHSGETERLCGDTIIQFETGTNKFCVLLCDGMGSGEAALEESRLTADLFRDFIKAGFIKDTAVRMINSTLAMKAGRESFSTIDFAEIDLRTGEAEFLKVGAAESFLKNKDKIEIIEAKALPVGILEEIDVPTIKRNLTEGDIIVMVSDGISETGYGALKGAWVGQIMENCNGNMQELADSVMKNAREKAYPKPCDDMTVAAIKIKKL